MNEKQQQLIFDKGITDVPSDVLCSDNALEEAMGMFYENGEHRPVQKPKMMFEINGQYTILYVHKFSDLDRYIGYTTTTVEGVEKKVLAWSTDGTAWSTTFKNKEGLDYTHYFNNTADIKITSIGKTLVASASDSPLAYFLWKNDQYLFLDQIPEPKVEFKLFDWRTDWVSEEDKIIVKYNGIIEDDLSVRSSNQEDYNNLIIGSYSKLKKSAANKVRFTNPFYARAAVRMYDGTYTMITNPILLVPNLTYNFLVDIAAHDFKEGWRTLVTHLFTCSLSFTQSTDYSLYADLVDEVVLFLSDEVEILDTISDVIHPDSRTPGSFYEYDSYSAEYRNPSYPTTLRKKSIEVSGGPILGIDTLVNVPLPEKLSLNDINTELEKVSNFYKIAEIGRKPISNFEALSKYASGNDLVNLVTQEQLPEDDYFSRSKLIPSFLYAYNSRLNIANASRGFFEGYDFFTPFNNSGTTTYRSYVTIQTDVQEVIVRHEYTSDHIQGIYFYYPDSRATHVKLFKYISGSYQCIMDHDLEEHPGLNGAYYFKGLQTEDYQETVISGSEPSYDNDAMEALPNYIITSEVNNPFVFKAEGYNKVGTGKILAMSTITQALSEGQFGQYPLLVFSDEGVWAMSVNDTGLFKSVHPMSREVLNNPKSVTQTDGAVFFSSDKGLMVVVGSQVKCMSEQLTGKSGVPFQDYLKNAFIAYDYRDSLLWILDGTRYSYLYSIKSGTFSRYDFGENNIITSVVNFYPDHLMQSGTKVYSLLERPNINHDGETVQGEFVFNKYDGQIISRPMKLENGLALKSIMQIKNIRMFDSGTVSLTIKASNDLKNWMTLGSLRGMPWKYYKFQYDFKDMIATDRFAGSVVITQERRTDKLR